MQYYQDKQQANFTIINKLTWTSLDPHWKYMLLSTAIVFFPLYLLLRDSYKFDENDLSLPKTYRYFYVTNGKNVIREEAYINEDGQFASFAVITLENDDNEEYEEYNLVGFFPMVL